MAAIRQDPERIRTGCVAKGYDASLVDEALTLDVRIRSLRSDLERERRIHKLDSRIHHLTMQLDEILVRLDLCDAPASTVER